MSHGTLREKIKIMKTEKWIKENTEDLSSKTVAISGATGGIGNELCRHFASLGAKILMLDRSTERSLAFAERLKAEFPSVKTEHIRLDLSDAENVCEVTKRLKKQPPDYLILNAGAYHVPRFTCALGYNNIFQINYISPYYMARTLLPYIKEKGGKIAAVGSIAHNYSHIDTNDRDFSTRKKSSLVYGNAKRYLMYSLSALSDGSIAIAHPGITFTNITAHYPKLIFMIIKHPMKIIFMKPRRASLSILSCIFKNTMPASWTGPGFFGIWGLPKEQPLKALSESEEHAITAAAEDVYLKMTALL